MELEEYEAVSKRTQLILPWACAVGNDVTRERQTAAKLSSTLFQPKTFQLFQSQHIFDIFPNFVLFFFLFIFTILQISKRVKNTVSEIWTHLNYLPRFPILSCFCIF